MTKIKKPSPILLTKEGFNKAKRDYDNLLSKREEVLLRLQAAREQGDLSENGAYTAAKFELGSIDREIRRLAHLLKYGVVATKKQSERVGFGSVVTLEKDGKEMTFVLVSKFESNLAEKKLSQESPFGRAVLNKKVGDIVRVQAPAGETMWKIVKVAYSFSLFSGSKV